MAEQVFVLSIGSIVGGSTPGNRVWREPIAEMTRRVAAARSEVPAPLNVNVVFQIPGNLRQPDFEGVRAGSFSKKDSLLMVQVALPQEPPEDARAYLLHAMGLAIDEAERWAQRRRLATDLEMLRGILSKAMGQS